MQYVFKMSWTRVHHLRKKVRVISDCCLMPNSKSFWYALTGHYFFWNHNGDKVLMRRSWLLHIWNGLERVGTKPNSSSLPYITTWKIIFLKKLSASLNNKLSFVIVAKWSNDTMLFASASIAQEIVWWGRAIPLLCPGSLSKHSSHSTHGIRWFKCPNTISNRTSSLTSPKWLLRAVIAFNLMIFLRTFSTRDVAPLSLFCARTWILLMQDRKWKKANLKSNTHPTECRLCNLNGKVENKCKRLCLGKQLTSEWPHHHS